MKRILLVTGIYPPAIGGPATYMAALAESLAKQNHTVTVLTYADAKPEERGGIKIRWIRRDLPKAVRWLRLLRELRRLIPAHDTVLVNGLPIQTALVHRITGRRSRLIVKVVGDGAWEQARLRHLTEVGIDSFQTMPAPRGIRLFKYLERWAVSQADTVITPSVYLKRIVSGWGVDPERVRVILNAPHDIDEGDTPSRESARRKLGIEDSTVVTAGRLVPWKGMSGLIRAMKHLPESVALIIVGDGPERSRLECVIEEEGLAATGRVRMAGRQSRDVLFQYMAAADAFVLNSEYEGLPHVILEAYACRAPVIATKVCGTPEAVRDGKDGILVPYGDEHQLARAIRRLIENKDEQERFAEAGWKRLKDFSWGRMIEETTRVLIDEEKIP